MRETKKRRNSEVKETNSKVLSKEELSRLETEEEVDEVEKVSETSENPQKEGK